MDTLSHGLYGGVLFGRQSKREYWTAFIFGIAPDILAFGPIFISAIIGLSSWPDRAVEPPNPLIVPNYVYTVYDFTHSLVVYAVFALIIWLIKRRNLLLLSLAWPLHILLDIPTHSSDFFPTPFLWPISDFSINGVPWAQPFIFIPNILIVISLYLFWYVKRRRIATAP